MFLLDVLEVYEVTLTGNNKEFTSEQASDSVVSIYIHTYVTLFMYRIDIGKKLWINVWFKERYYLILTFFIIVLFLV